MTIRWRNCRAPLATIPALVAILALPVTGALATYSQIVRDESGCCVAQSSGWSLDTSTWNGYDTNTKYGASDYFSGAGPWFQWFPSPNPSPLYLCSYVHIPTIRNHAWIYFSDSEGRSTGSIYQADWANHWINATNGSFNSSDYLQLNSGPGNQFSSNTYSADAVAFHYNGC